MKANKSFAAGVRQAKWSLERKIERMETCRKTKYVGLLTIPTGKGEEFPEGFKEKYQMLMRKIVLATRNTVLRTLTRDRGNRHEV